jgi:hypothetical protein
MHFFFSGLESQAELRMITQGGATHVLVDPHQYRALGGLPDGFRVALDSGAYRHFKRGSQLDVNTWQRNLENLPLERFDWITAPDVIGDPERTWQHWQRVRHLPKILPVYPWGDGRERLLRYLEDAPVVGIGGLVPLVRSKIGNRPRTKAEQAARERVLEELVKLCSAHPCRFHAFGLAWVKAINHLAPYLVSTDSSKWLSGRRYRKAITLTRAGKLGEAAMRFVPDAPRDADALCVYNVRHLQNFAEGSDIGSTGNDLAAAA